MSAAADFNDARKLATFFAELRARRDARELAYTEFAPRLSPRFNTFNFLRPGEVKLSELLAALLSPTHHHAQGSLFLRLFLRALNLEHHLEEDGTVQVTCEARTDCIERSARRIDIEINLGKFGLAIENKPWAGDQDEQLADYGRQLQAKYVTGKWCLVYLTANGTEPSPASLPEVQRQAWLASGQYAELSYSDMVHWLSACEAQCKSDHVRHFLRDFIDYCNQEFFGSNAMNSDLVRDITLQPDNLELALIVAQEIPNIKGQLFDQFVRDLRVALHEQFPGWEIVIPDNYRVDDTHYRPITLKKPEWKNCHFALEFFNKRCNGFHWGVRKESEATPNLPGVFDAIQAALPYRGEQADWWLWRVAFEPYTNWDNDITLWPALRNGHVVNMIIKNLLDLRDAVEAVIDTGKG
ncbi:MAG TPA: PD-(D/E)XK nuclease family protein [Noviherbaspirillum sp.]|nr:PD-(D/E)XK nuclease family protein [Noviherbaspirillum sp.]